MAEWHYGTFAEGIIKGAGLQLRGVAAGRRLRIATDCTGTGNAERAIQCPTSPPFRGVVVSAVSRCPGVRHRRQRAGT